MARFGALEFQASRPTCPEEERKAGHLLSMGSACGGPAPELLVPAVCRLAGQAFHPKETCGASRWPGGPAGSQWAVRGAAGEALWKHEDGAQAAKVWRWKGALSPRRCPFTGKPWAAARVPWAFTEGAELCRLHGEGLFVLKQLQPPDPRAWQGPSRDAAGGQPASWGCPLLEAPGDPDP